MASLSLVEIKQSQLGATPIIAGQLVFVTDTGYIYKDDENTRVSIGKDVLIVDELPLAPISNRIYLLKPNSLYIYDAGWVCLNEKSDSYEHTHDVSDIIGLLSEEKHTTLTPFWEYSEDMIPYMEMPQSDGIWSVYSISDNTSPESWIGSTITTIDGETIEITSDNTVMTLNGLYNIKHPVDSRDYLLVFTSDFDPSVIGLETLDIGTYAVRSSSGWGVASVSTPTEVTENVILKELLPEPLRIGETGLKINWDGTSTSACLDLTDTFGTKFYKMVEPINTIYNARYSYTTKDLDINSGGYKVDDSHYIQIEGAEYSAQFDLWNVKTSNPLTVDTTPIGGLGIISISFPEPGLYFVWNNADSFIKGFVSADYGVIQFDKKYIPNLSNKADLIDGVIPISQIPIDDIISALPSGDEVRY